MFILVCGAAIVTNRVAASEVAIARENNLNVRGQPTLGSEVITKLKKGESVTILDEIVRSKTKAGDPTHWAKIAMPANTPVWTAAMFIDNSSQTVIPSRLNLRAGPGENYSVIGRLEHGVAVTPISSKDGWVEIEQPPGTYAFVAMDLLERKTTVPTTENPLPPAIAADPILAQTPVIVPFTTTTAAIQRAATDFAATKPIEAKKPEAAVAPRLASELQAIARLTEISLVAPPPMPIKRIVRREGYVADTVSIQAPTPLGLDGLTTRRVISFLHPTSTNLVLKKFKGRRVVVTGEEGIDRRWLKVPVLRVESIELLPE